MKQRRINQKQHENQHATRRDAAKSEKPNLAIAQLLNLLKRAPPNGGRDKGEQAFNDQGQAQSHPQNQPKTVAFQAYFLPGAAAGRELPRKALKNSLLDGSTTITSPFLLKLALLASRLR